MTSSPPPAEYVREARATIGYGLIERRIQETIEREAAKLRTCSASDLARLQGFIAGLECALGIPAALIIEAGQ